MKEYKDLTDKEKKICDAADTATDAAAAAAYAAMRIKKLLLEN